MLAAKNGSVEGQFNIGVCYENGKGVAKNMETAAKWYLKAAEQGDVRDPLATSSFGATRLQFFAFEAE